MGLEGCPYTKNIQTKNGSDHATSEPLFISTARFELLVASPLTLLLIGRRFLLLQLRQVQITRFAIILKLYYLLLQFFHYRPLPPS